MLINDFNMFDVFKKTFISYLLVQIGILIIFILPQIYPLLSCNLNLDKMWSS